MNTTLAAIPDEIKKLHRAVCWRYEERDGKQTKVPYNPRTGRRASSTAPETWSTFAECEATQDDYDGIGVVLGEGLAGIDLDDCIENGVVISEAQAIVDSVPTYWEVSPSGNGLKALVHGAKPDGLRNRVKPETFKEIEVYDSGRYFTLTGQHYGEHNFIANGDTFANFCRKYLPPKEKSVSKPIASRLIDVDDTVLLDKARNASNGAKFIALYDQGDTSLYDGDDSRADLALVRALAFWTGGDEARIDRLFRGSALYRDKWDREDYRRSTIDTALSGMSEFYSGSSRGSFDWFMGQREQDGDILCDVSVPIPIAELIKAHPRLREPVIEGLLRAGETMNVIASPKVGKSWLMYDLLYSIATGGLWLDAFRCTPGRVLLIDNELHPQNIANRLPKVTAAIGTAVPENIDVLSLRGKDITLDRLADYIEHIERDYYRAIVLDAWYRFIPTGMNENSNADIMRLYNMLDRYADQTGAAFIVVHHASKGSQGEKRITDVGAGAGAQSRAADTHVVLRAHEEEGCFVLEAAVRSFEPVEPFGLRWDFPQWRHVEGLDVKALQDRKTLKERRQQDKDAEGRVKILKVLKSGPLTTTKLCQSAGGMGKDRANRLLGQLLQDGEVIYEEVKVRGQDAKEWALAE